MICLRKKGVKGGVSSKEGNFGHFLQFWGVFSLLHPPTVPRLPNSVWNQYQPSLWIHQGRFDPSSRNFFLFFLIILAIDHSDPILGQFQPPGGGPVVISPLVNCQQSTAVSWNVLYFIIDDNLSWKKVREGRRIFKRGQFWLFFAILGGFQLASPAYSAKTPKSGMNCVPNLFLNVAW